VVDGHLHFQDEGVASLFENNKELLAEVIEEELKVRATVPAATQPGPLLFGPNIQILHQNSANSS